MIFVRLAIMSMNWISQQQKLFKVLEWITIVIILALAAFSFNAAAKRTGFTSAMPTNIRHPFWSGVLLSGIDPLKIPFWVLWSTFLMTNKILIPQSHYFNFYVVGIGLGSLLGFLIFIYGGNYLIGAIKTQQEIINWVIGGILLITAIIQVYRTSRPKTSNILSAQKNEEAQLFLIE